MVKQNVAVVGTLDTKDPEYKHLLACLHHYGLEPILIDVSCHANSTKLSPPFSCEEVAYRGGKTFHSLALVPRGEASKTMIAGAIHVCQQLLEEGKLQGIIALGGANGSLIASAIMKTLPSFLPKIIISVIGASEPRENVATKDIILFNCVADMCLNGFTGKIIDQAAASLAGMLTLPPTPVSTKKKKPIGSTMMGLTQDCVVGTKDILEQEDYEVFVFHSNGYGGRAMEEMIENNELVALLDLTLNELVNDLVDGVFNAGPLRCETALKKGIPVLFAPGAMDFANFWGRNIPEKFSHRHFLFHNAQNTLMRMTDEEIFLAGQRLGKKINQGKGPVSVLIPQKGLSANDKEGSIAKQYTASGEYSGPWFEPSGPKSFLSGLQSSLTRRDVCPILVDAHVNEPAFIHKVVDEFKKICSN